MPPLSSLDPRRVGLSSLAAALAYLAVNALDMRLLRYPQNDLVLQGRMLPIFPKHLWPLTGLIMHTGFGATLTALYALLGRDRLPGPPWLRGVAWLLTENTLLWPLVLLLDRHHPAVRDGQMPPLSTMRCFIQANLRHIAFGAVMALAYEALAPNSESRDGRP